GLVHFFAVLGITTDADRLRPAAAYSYMLAGVVYCMRVLSVEKLLPSARRDQQTDRDRERFLEHRERFLADGSYSPMSEALSLLAYAKHMALAAGSSGSAYWSKDKNIFYLHGRPIYISRFRAMAQDLVAEAEQMLWEELLWVTRAEERFAVQLDALVDDVAFERRGVSFVQHRDNGLKDKLEWMLTQAERTEEGRRLQSSSSSSDGRRWNVKQVKRYLRCVDRFLSQGANSTMELQVKLDYAQESGRAGRDGLMSEAVMIVQEGEQRAADDKQAEVEQQLVREYIHGRDGAALCRRVVLDGYLDRRERVRVRCEEGEERCDVCRQANGDDGDDGDDGDEMETEGEASATEDEVEVADATETDNTEGEAEQEAQQAQQALSQQQRVWSSERQRLVRQRQGEFADMEWLRRQLARWTNRCAICEAIDKCTSGHSVQRCWRLESRTVKEVIKKVEKKIKYKDYSYYFLYRLLQEICN
ncbi:hypothetical protein G6514_005716, partial [Epicoccum nigrum]